MTYIKNFDASLGDCFHVGGTISDKILIFDVDDTLIFSNANVRVSSVDGIFKKILTSSEYNTYVLQDDEVLDFSEFESVDLLTDADVTKYWHTMIREYRKGTHICILTARSNHSVIKEFLLRKGVDIKDALIMCCSSEDYPFDGNVHERKAKSINHLYELGYRTFVFFDDNENNLLEAKKLEDNYNDISINVVHVDERG